MFLPVTFVVSLSSLQELLFIKYIKLSRQSVLIVLELYLQLDSDELPFVWIRNFFSQIIGTFNMGILQDSFDFGSIRSFMTLFVD